MSKFQLHLTPGKLHLEIPGLLIHGEGQPEFDSRSPGTPPPTSTNLQLAPTRIQADKFPQKIDAVNWLVTLSALAVLGIQLHPTTWTKVESYLRNPKVPLSLIILKSPVKSLATISSPVPEAPLLVGERIGEYKITSGYGARVSPCQGCSSFHPAIDVGTPVGTPLYALGDATIYCKFQAGITGKYIEYTLPNASAYGLPHGTLLQILHVNSCTSGKAKKGQPIGTTGAAGTGAHSDFRVKLPEGSRSPVGLGAIAVVSLYPKGTGGEFHPYALQWPTAGTFTQPYQGSHLGIDIANATGTPIRAAQAGRVIWAGWNQFGLGNTVKLLHDDGTVTAYGHLQSFSVRFGDRVQTFDPIGQMGNEGNSTGSHLHFEYSINNQPINPLDYLL